MRNDSHLFEYHVFRFCNRCLSVFVISSVEIFLFNYLITYPIVLWFDRKIKYVVFLVQDE